MATLDSSTSGALAEQAALFFLQKRGLKLIAKNFYCKYGEIDLIMQDKDCVVFVEVRLRQHACYGQGLETITAQKKRRLIKASTTFLLQKKWMNKMACRFDIISLTYLQNSSINWIKNAFDE